MIERGVTHMQIIIPESREWIKNGILMDILKLPRDERCIVSVVGAGGKSTTIEKLALEYKENQEALIVTTTTHMYQPSSWSWCKEENIQKILDGIMNNKVVWVGEETENGKMRSFDLAFMESLSEIHVPMIVEADGSKHYPCKIPSKKEPVILSSTDFVVAVVGLTALGCSWNEACFRYELGEEVFYKKYSEDYPMIQKEDLVRILSSDLGLRKCVDVNMRYAVMLNQVDTDDLLEKAFEIREELSKLGIHEVYISCYKTDV